MKGESYLSSLEDGGKQVCSADGRYGEFEWEGGAKEAGEAKNQQVDARETRTAAR
jgi:hypothetical protein